MISETRVTIARYGKKQDLDIVIPTFVVPRKLMQKRKDLIDCGSLGTSLLSYFHILKYASRPSLLLDHQLVHKEEVFT